MEKEAKVCRHGLTFGCAECANPVAPRIEREQPHAVDCPCDDDSCRAFGPLVKVSGHVRGCTCDECRKRIAGYHANDLPEPKVGGGGVAYPQHVSFVRGSGGGNPRTPGTRYARMIGMTPIKPADKGAHTRRRIAESRAALKRFLRQRGRLDLIAKKKMSGRAGRPEEDWDQTLRNVEEAFGVDIAARYLGPDDAYQGEVVIGDPTGDLAAEQVDASEAAQELPGEPA